MTRLISDPRRLLLVALLAVAAGCTPAPVCPAPPLPVADAPWPSDDNPLMGVNATAQILQLNPYTDPKTRADPYPCARAAVAAQRNHTALPRCYYVPMSLR